MVHLGVNLCAGTTSRLAVVAAGTGNDFARNLGLPVRDPRGAVALLADGRTREIDLGRVTHGVAGETWFGWRPRCRLRRRRQRARAAMSVAAGADALQPRDHARAPGVPAHPVRRRARRSPPRDRAMLVAVANRTSFGGGHARVSRCRRTRRALRRHDRPRAVDPVVPPGLSQGLLAEPTRPSGRRDPSRPASSLGGERYHSQADGETFADLPIDAEVVPGALRVVAADRR